MPFTAGLISELASWNTTLSTDRALGLKTFRLVKGYSQASTGLHATFDIHQHFTGCNWLTCMYSRSTKIDTHRSVCSSQHILVVSHWRHSRWLSSTELQASTQGPTHSQATTQWLWGIHFIHSSKLPMLAPGGDCLSLCCKAKRAFRNNTEGFLCGGFGEAFHDWVSNFFTHCSIS